MSVILRNFLYLDSQLLNDYLSTIEGVYYDESTITEKSEKVGEGSLDGGLGIIKGSGKAEISSGVEITKQVKKTDAAKFQQLYNYLKEEDAFKYYEQITPEIWAEFRREEILEGLVSIRFSKMEEMMGAINQVSSLIGVIESVSGDSIIDDKTMEAINGFKALDQMQQSKGIPCVMTFIGSKEYKLIAYLNPKFFKVPKEQVIGELNVFCKIQRMITKNERIELVDFLSSVKSIPMNREQRRTMPKNLTAPPEFRDTVKGPAAVVIPIAIYR